MTKKSACIKLTWENGKARRTEGWVIEEDFRPGKECKVLSLKERMAFIRQSIGLLEELVQDQIDHKCIKRNGCGYSATALSGRRWAQLPARTRHRGARE